MKKNFKKALVIGSGPIVIGQSAEFDYSGTQACRALREEGIEVVLVNSNPATIQTDEITADKIYIEPLTLEVLTKIIEKEKPDGILATVGGQTALNLAKELYVDGVLEKNNVEFMGTNAAAIERAENREEFNKTMQQISVPILPGETVNTIEAAKEFANKIGYPVIIRPSFTLGGSGAGIANNELELTSTLELAFRLSTIHEALIEKSITGWGEFEYEVIRDEKSNSIIVCTMENIDPMGVHTGESIVVAPTQTLNDFDHQRFRNAAIKIVNAIGVKGGCNVQFALNYKTGEYVVIEVNPRLSRSSALASKATGYPIARVATKIALGYELHEITNAITGTNAAFEPALDYIVTKIPRWPFDKFPLSNRNLGPQMKSTGETMAIGKTFEESLQKAIRGLEIKNPTGQNFNYNLHLQPATDMRIFALLDAFRNGETIEEIYDATKINTWFLEKIKNITTMEQTLRNQNTSVVLIKEAKKMGFTDLQIAKLTSKTEEEIRKYRIENKILPTYKTVDSCAGEFNALTPYYYSTYEYENEATELEGQKVVIIGSGPIRIGQGIEFDYCCCHASFALKEMGYKSIVINNNPETVSTDFDTSDRLYFEPLTFEDVMNVIENEKPLGVILQLGGQTSINLAKQLTQAGVKILGTQLKGITIAEDREQFRQLLKELDIPQPANATATTKEEAIQAANQITYPVVVRPSWVIAGRGMQILTNQKELLTYLETAEDISQDKPLLIDKYLENAIECEVDAIDDGETLLIGAIQEHIEPAGIHSGDANIVIPTINLSQKHLQTIEDYTKKISRAINNIGLLNIQLVIQNDTVYLLEANPRASRTVPFVSKTYKMPLVKIATNVLLGKKIKDMQIQRKMLNGYSVKGVVFPFLKLKGTDSKLGPEMRSTGETMAIASNFETAFYKSLLAAGIKHQKGKALISICDDDKKHSSILKQLLLENEFEIIATSGTAKALNCKEVAKIGLGTPNCLDLIQNAQVTLVINTPGAACEAQIDGVQIRRNSIEKGIPCITNIQTAIQWLKATKHVRDKELENKETNQYNTQTPIFIPQNTK